MVVLLRRFLGLLMFLPASVSALQIQADYVTVNGNAWVAVTFAQAFSVDPVVVSLTDDKGGGEAAVRIRNVTTTGFEIGVLEPAGANGSYPTTSLPFLAVEPGVHVFPNGDILQAGTTSVTVQQRGYFALFPAEGWQTQSFPQTFPINAVVVGTIQTMNNQPAGGPGTPSIPFLTTAIRNVNTSKFDLALERSSWNDGGNTVVAETIGWVAMAAGTFGSFSDSSGGTIQYESFNTGDNVQGWDQGCYQRPTTGFQNTYVADPVVVASKNSHDGNDGGWVRQCDLSTTQVGLTIDDTPSARLPRGTERVHTTEQVGVLVFEKAFLLGSINDPEPLLKKTVVVDSDPVNGISSSKAIPDAEVLYTIRVENLGDGVATNVRLDDDVPANMDLYVGNTENCGSVEFRDGTPSSGLLCSALGVSYDDGSGDYIHTPAPGLTFDPLITDIRIEFTGSLAANGVAGVPSFEVDLRMRVR